jgi:signal transduction histidine kinase
MLHEGLRHLRDGHESEGIEDLETASTSGWLEARYQLALLYARKGRRRGALRQQAIDHLEAIVAATHQEQAETLSAGLDRVHFALGGLLADGETEEDLAAGISSYRDGLTLNPLSATGHNQLGRLLLRTSQPLGALGEYKVALQLDPEMRAAYSDLAHLLFHHVNPDDLADEFSHIVAEFGERAPAVLAQLSQELVELGRGQVYRGLYTKGHQLKNLMGMGGSRMRRLARSLNESEPDLPLLRTQMEELQADQERLYEEWVGYLSSMTPDQLTTGLVDPASVAKRVTDAVSGARSEASVKLRVQEGAPRIEADERLLREALTNLCMNAIEALAAADGLAQGEVGVGIGYDEPAGVVYFEVEDNGSGIPAEQLEHVFDPGFTTKEQGNGYGLSIARRIVQAHHGQLRVKSRVGHGTVFRLDLPVNFDADSAPVSLAGTSL